MAGVGHNSGIYNEDDVLTGAAQTRLNTIVERAVRLMEDRDTVSQDLSEVMAEAKGEGFDTKYIRKVVALMRKDRVKAKQEQELLRLYAEACGCGDLV